MGRRRAAGEPRDRHIEAAPEEMHRARLAEKSRAELLEHPIHVDEDAPELLRVTGIISRVLAVLVKRNWVGELDRHRPDPDFQPERFQPVHDLVVEIGNRARPERQAFRPPVAHLYVQAMIDEIEVDLKTDPALVRDRRSREAAASHVERHLPPMVHHRRLGEADLADDLRPKMQGGAGVLPRIVRQRWPGWDLSHVARALWFRLHRRGQFRRPRSPSRAIPARSGWPRRRAPRGERR